MVVLFYAIEYLEFSNYKQDIAVYTREKIQI
jgi:hypothetical protein